MTPNYLRLDLRIPLRDLRAMLLTPYQRPHLNGNAAIPHPVPRIQSRFAERESRFCDCPLTLLRLYDICSFLATSFDPVYLGSLFGLVTPLVMLWSVAIIVPLALRVYPVVVVEAAVVRRLSSLLFPDRP